MNKDTDCNENLQEKHETTSAKSSAISRRDMLRKSSLAVTGAIAAPLLLGNLASEVKAGNGNGHPKLTPNYFPLKNFRPQIDLSGKLAVITGASRGLGRAVGEALSALGVFVIGTSRNPVGVPNPPAFPLLPLDIADPSSVFAFSATLQAHPYFQQRGRVDILINNAGRFVIGQIIPLPPTDFSFYLSQRDLGMRTLYSGHVVMTNVMLPLMSHQDYSRIMFTASVQSYYTGAGIPGGSGFDVYTSGKAALRGYANNLGAALLEGGSSLRVSTVNPYIMNTTLVEHPNPIYTQPVNSSGLSDTDLLFNAGITQIRQLSANALPPSMVGETYAQLLQMTAPERNVVVASPREPLATQGGNYIHEPAILAENQLSAVPFK